MRGWRAAGPRATRRHPGVAGRPARSLGLRVVGGDARLRRLLGLRRSRRGAAALRPRGATLGADGDAGRAHGPACAAADLARLREAAELRGPGAAPVGRAALLRRLVAGSLDRAVDVAATLELRGYALPGRARPAAPDAAGRSTTGRCWPSAALVVMLVAGGQLAGVGGFEPYPSLVLDAGARDAGAGGRPVALRAGALRRRGRARALTAPAGSGVAPLPEPVLDFAGLLLPLPGRRPGGAARRSTWSWTPGEFAVLAGRSGSGKTTLLRAACGLVPHFHGGEVSGELRGRRPRRPRPRPGRAGRPRRLRRPGARDAGGQHHGARRRSSCPLELRGDGARGARPGGGGGGAGARRSRTCSSAAPTPSPAASCSGWPWPRRWCRGRALLLLDEPTSQLDPVAGDELIWLLRRLNEEWGVTVLLAEHRLERCLAAADRVVALDGGEVAFDGAPAGVPRLGAERRPRAGHAGGAAVRARGDRARCRSACERHGAAGRAWRARRRRLASSTARGQGTRSRTRRLSGTAPSPSRGAARFRSRRRDAGEPPPCARRLGAPGGGEGAREALRGADLRSRPASGWR